jgi:hypothetical protein
LFFVVKDIVFDFLGLDVAAGDSVGSCVDSFEEGFFDGHFHDFEFERVVNFRFADEIFLANDAVPFDIVRVDFVFAVQADEFVGFQIQVENVFAVAFHHVVDHRVAVVFRPRRGFQVRVVDVVLDVDARVVLQVAYVAFEEDVFGVVYEFAVQAEQVFSFV